VWVKNAENGEPALKEKIPRVGCGKTRELEQKGKTLTASHKEIEGKRQASAGAAAGGRYFAQDGRAPVRARGKESKRVVGIGQGGGGADRLKEKSHPAGLG